MWKVVFENYKINKAGIVKSISRRIKCGSGWRVIPEKTLSVFSLNGYDAVNINSTKIYVHRLLAIAFIPNPKKLKYVTRKDKKGGYELKNLEWSSRGKLDKNDLKEIIKLRNSGIKCSNIAKKFRISVSMVSHIYKGRRY